MITVARYRERLAHEFPDEARDYEEKDVTRLVALADELIVALERARAADPSSDWGTPTELGAPDRDPAT